MSRMDVFKVLVMLSVAAGAVALLCYARVDLGMSWAQVADELDGWTVSLTNLTVFLWSQIIVAVIMLFGLKVYSFWREKRAQK